MQGFADSIFWRFLKTLFPLNGCRGLAGDVINDPVDALDLVDDAGGDLVQHVVGDAGPVGGHKVAGGDGAESQSVVIGPAVTHNAHGTHVGEHREILVHGALQMGLSDLVPENEVCQAQSVQLVLRHLADDPDGKARTRERLAHDQILRQAQLPTKLTDLVLEQVAQRLDDFLKVNVVGQTADVVVALDRGRFAAKAGLDPDNLPALLVFLVLTTLGSVACLKWIEQPAARWLKRKIA